MKDNADSYISYLKSKGVTKLYHFTDRDNLSSIIEQGGIYSWKDCEDRGISVPRPGGSDTSYQSDRRRGLEYYVHTGFCKDHPAKYAAMNEGRIFNPVVLEISLDVVKLDSTLFSDIKTADNHVNIGGDMNALERVCFDIIHSDYSDLDDYEKKQYQAEVLVEHFIPLQYITNIGDFAIPVNITSSLSSAAAPKYNLHNPYTARITRDTPTAFIFLIDQSASMSDDTIYKNDYVTLSEAAARCVNEMLRELVSRCTKGDSKYHYFDIAAIGYGHEVCSAWGGNLSGRDFVSPQDLADNPVSEVIEEVERKTPMGTKIITRRQKQWIQANHDGDWTHLHKALRRAKRLAQQWIDEHAPNCFPPTIINITDGQYNHISDADIRQIANEVKSMGTNDGNVIFMNIHIVPYSTGIDDILWLPEENRQIDDTFCCKLRSLSSLMPIVYNQAICDVKQITYDSQSKTRFYGLAVGLPMNKMIQMLKVGTTQTTHITQQ